MKIVPSLLAPAIIMASSILALTANAQRSASTTVIRGTVHPQAMSSADRGTVAGSMSLPEIQIYLAPSGSQRAALSQYLSDQRNPQSSSFHKWLTPAQFGATFGVSASDEAQLRMWLQSEGFTNIKLSTSRTVLTFSGTATQATHAFRTSIHSLVRDGQQHYANVSDIAIPASLAHLIQSVRGLDDFKPHALVVRPKAQFTNSQGNVGIAPGDIATIYDIQGLYSAGIDGTGVTAAVVGQTNIDLSDIAAYRSGFNLPANQPTVVFVPNSTDPGTSTVDRMEADLDLELLGAVARNSQILYVNSSNVFTSLQYAIDQNLAQVISISYGSCESNNTAYYQSLELLGEQANAQGITLIAASGDTGAANCDSTSVGTAQYGLAVDSPASAPEFTGVGGTDFTSPNSSYFGGTNSAQGGSAISYIPEVSWNTTNALGYLSASGGGASSIYAKPSWQEGPGVPTDGKRDVPDVAMYSMSATSAYIICTGGNCSGTPNFINSGELLGGTSAAAPVFAGIIALANQYLVTNGAIPAPGLGNINPHLYLLAANTGNVFHDISQGNNIVPCTASTVDCSTGTYGYSAGAGYDQVTGLGSVDAFNLLREWSNYSITGTSIALTASSSTSTQGGSVTFTAKVTAKSGSTIPTGSVIFYANGSVIGTVSLNGSGAASLPIATLSAGLNKIQAAYTGSMDFSQSLSSALSETILQPTSTSLMLSANQLIQGGKLTMTATVVGSGQFPTGNVTFYNGTTALGTANLTSGTATFSTSSLPIGTDSLSASYSGDTTFGASTSAVVPVTVTTATPISTTTTLSASPTQASEGATVTLTASVAPATGTTQPTGSVTFYNGTTALGTANLTSGTATFSTTSLPIGTDSLSASYSGDSYFSPSSSATVAVVIVQPSFSVAASPSSLSVTGGQNATTTLTITPSNGFNQSLSFSCSGLPSGSTCTFGAPSVQGNGTTTVSLSISTKTLSAALARPLSSSTPLLALLPFLGIFSIRRRKVIVRALQFSIIAIAVFTFGAGMVGCGGGGSTPPPTQPTSPTPVTSTVTVTATPQSGAAHTTQITLTVK